MLGLIFAAGCSPGVDRVVLVTIDTLRADHVGCYGSEWVETPALDAVAAAGVRFEVAVAPTPLTLPSHTSLMTALDPPRHGVRNNSTFRLAEEIPTLAEHLRTEGLDTAAFVGAVVLDRQYGLGRGFEVYDDRMAPRRAAAAVRFSFSERTADQVVDAALAWLQAAPERFFLWVHVYDPHANYQPPRRFRARFPVHPYAGEIAFVDEEIGRLLGAVHARWDRERTLVVVTSDHGESLGEHGELSHSLTVYDATQRIPLLLSGPGLPRGHVAREPVRLVDVAPTILALVGAEALPAADGRDLRAALRNGDAAGRLAYVETLAPQIDFGWSPLLGVRSQRFKYIRAPRPELYDLAADPGETENLFEQEPDVAARLDEELEALLADARPPERTAPADATMRERLEALGYVVGETSSTHQGLGRVGGIDPKDGLALAQALIEANTLAVQNRPAEALALLEPLEGGGYILELHRAEFAREAGQPKRAEAYARAALALGPDLPSVHNVLGEALLDQGRLDEAAETFEGAHALDEAAGDPLVGLGRVAEARSQLDRAAEFYQRATEQRGASGEALWRLAALRIEAGQDARSLLNQLPVELVLRPEAALRLASAEARAGRHHRARTILNRALDAAPDSAELRRALDALGSERP